MRPLPPETAALIDELWQHQGLPGRWAWQLVHVLLQRIAATRQSLAIAHVLPWTLHEDREIAEAAGHAVQQLCACVEVRDLSELDRTLRRPLAWARQGWHDMAARDLRRLAGLGAGPTLLQLAMCHPSGYLREEAIRRCATCADGSELPFLLLRANDWVRPVRELAHAALRARLGVRHLPDLVAALPILDAMHRWGRLKPTGIVDDIERLLLEPEAVPPLFATLGSPLRALRLGALRRLLAHQRLAIAVEPPGEGQGPYRTPPSRLRSKYDVVEAGLRDPDPVVRVWVARWLIAADPALFEAFADQLVRGRVGSVRFGALYRLRSAGRPIPWTELLLDRHGGVRGLAQDAALEAGADPDTEYRAHITSSHGKRLGTALLGLGETGGVPDARLVRGYLDADRPVVRKSALQALASLEVDDLVELAVAALCDPSPGVTRAAHDLLVARAARVRAADLWSALVATPTPAGKRYALAVLSRLRSTRPPPAIATQISELLATSSLPADLRGRLAALVDGAR